VPIAPPASDPDMTPPDADETRWLCRGFISAAAPPEGLTETQRLLLAALVPAMTGFDATFDGPPVVPDEFASGLARRTIEFRSRIVQNMVLLALVLRPLPAAVAERITSFARELSVDEDMLTVTSEFAADTLGLAAVDFDRNGYSARWNREDAAVLHTTAALASAWDLAADDPALAQRWADLEHLPPGTLGRRVTELYRARGFTYPGLPGSAPPLLAQHDWVHVLADYGTTVESELEVFAFIARANDDPTPSRSSPWSSPSSRPGTCAAERDCSRPHPGTFPRPAWPPGSLTPYDEAHCAQATSTSSGPTGSPSPNSPSTPPENTSGSLAKPRLRCKQVQSDHGSAGNYPLPSQRRHHARSQFRVRLQLLRSITRRLTHTPPHVDGTASD